MALPRSQFDSLALAQLDAMYRLARRLTHNAADAEDLVQETFARALRSRDRFELQDFGIRPWLLRILYNLYLNRATREKRQPVASSDEKLEPIPHPGAAPLPLDPSSFQAMDEHLVKALEELPPDYRAVMLLWAVEELSYKEIAQVLDVPIGTVMSRLHRARQRLAEQLQEYARQEGLLRH